MFLSSAKTVPVDVVGSSTFGRYKKISNQYTYNMYISDGWLINFAGWKRIYDFLTDQGGNGRGLFVSIRNNIMVSVINSAVFVINSALSVSFVGNIDSSVGDVFMDENLNDQICIVDGRDAYIYNFEFGSLTKQDLSRGLIANYVCYHNTFFLIGNGDKSSNGAAWYAYKYDTPTTIVEQTQLALQTKSDYAIAILRIPGGGNNVIVFGTAVSELWTQVGGINNYQRVASFNIDYGCLSVSTLASSDKFVMWLGINETSSPSIMLFSGGGAERISTDGIDYVLKNIKYPQQSTAFLFRDDGHLFYQITFYNAADNLTLIYDLDTQKFFHLTDADSSYHPARRIAYFNENIYFVSLKNTSLYQTSSNFTTYNENLSSSVLDADPTINKIIPRVRITSSLRAQSGAPFRARNFTFILDQGNDPYYSELNVEKALPYIVTEGDDPDYIVTESGQKIIAQGDFSPGIFYAPKVELAVSFDSGESFSSNDSTAFRVLGQRQNIINWTEPLGLSNDLTFRLTFWTRSYVCFYNGSVEVY